MTNPAQSPTNIKLSVTCGKFMHNGTTSTPLLGWGIEVANTVTSVTLAGVVFSTNYSGNYTTNGGVVPTFPSASCTLP